MKREKSFSDKVNVEMVFNQSSDKLLQHMFKELTTDLTQYNLFIQNNKTKEYETVAIAIDDIENYAKQHPEKFV